EGNSPPRRRLCTRSGMVSCPPRFVPHEARSAFPLSSKKSARREVPDICYRSHPLRPRLPERLHFHPDVNVLGPHPAMEVQYPHPTRGTVDLDHGDKNRILPPARVDIHVAD